MIYSSFVIIIKIMNTNSILVTQLCSIITYDTTDISQFYKNLLTLNSSIKNEIPNDCNIYINYQTDLKQIQVRIFNKENDETCNVQDNQIKNISVIQNSKSTLEQMINYLLL